MPGTPLELLRNVIDPGYCVGCGACTAIDDSPFTMALDGDGNYRAMLTQPYVTSSDDYGSVCPFSSGVTETDIAHEAFDPDGLLWNNDVGFYRELYFANVTVGKIRENGSSGGMATWVLTTLLHDQLIDAVIHVRPASNDGDPLFRFDCSMTEGEVADGSKTRYYPVTMAEALALVKDNDLRYAVIGIPCFIKAVRLLQSRHDVFRRRIVFTVGLFCGHMKSSHFADAIAWEMGIDPGTLKAIDFRAKTQTGPASTYSIVAQGNSRGESVTRQRSSADLFAYDWGVGLFRHTACNYCDDVMSETADLSVGDAWLQPYVEDPRGNNVVVVRSMAASALISAHADELLLVRAEAEDVARSQAAALRDRREGLSYRLYLKDAMLEPRPIKRIDPSNTIPDERKAIYRMRMRIQGVSLELYKEALRRSDYSVFTSGLRPWLKEYRLLYSQEPALYEWTVSIIRAMMRKFERLMRRIGHRA